MKDSAASPLQQLVTLWTRSEILQSVNGSLPPALTEGERAFSARFVECNAKKAEAIALSGSLDPFQKVRSFLYRGRITDASNLIDQLRCEPHAQTSQVSAELLLEEARVSAFRGRWIESIERCNQALAQDPAPLSRLTLFQVRSVAFFEIGELDKALRDIEKIESLAELYPKSFPSHYAHILRIRITARTEGVVEAERLLDAFWKKSFESGLLNLDLILVLARAEIDLRRIAGRCAYSAALASYYLADRLGDSLYRSLAEVDLFFSSGNSGDRLSYRLEQGRVEFERVSRLIDEAQALDSAGISMTARAIRLSVGSKDNQSVFIRENSEMLNLLFFERTGFLVRLDPFLISRIAPGSRTHQAIRILLKNGPTEKSKFFRAIWGQQRFTPTLHDGVIRTLLHRVRRLTGPVLVSDHAVIELKRALMVGDA